MTNFRVDSMALVLIASTVVVVFNAIAVTSGAADGFYAEVQHWISSYLQ